MSDTEHPRPENAATDPSTGASADAATPSTPAAEGENSPPAAAAGAPTPPAPTTGAPTPPVSPGGAGSPPVSPTGDPRPAAPASPVSPGAGAAPASGAAAAGRPALPPYPAAYPVPPRTAPPAPGAYPGASFGQGPAAPTAPLAGAPTATAAAPRPPSRAGRTVGLLVAAAIVGGVAGLGGAYAGSGIWSGSTETTASGPQVVTVNNTDDVTNVNAVAAKALPSVVTIAASSGGSSGSGSGVILSEDGYVLTNTHVVTLGGATANPDLTVTTSDGSVYRATIVGTDPTYDLAVIQLTNAEGLTPIEFADSSALNVGDAAVAVGAPLGLDNTVTTGIVSALNRSIEIASAAAPDDEIEDGTEGTPGEEGPFQFDFGQGQGTTEATSSIKITVIQTDAAINPGNSGGALVDDQGQLIGINVAIASSGGTSSSTAGNIGVGFSIPSNVAERIADEIIATGQATHGLLGAIVQNAAAAENATILGALISETSAGGAAEQAGLRAGDIVTGFDGVPITSAIDLTAQVRAVAAGSEVTIEYVRDGQTRTAEVTLGTLE